MCGIAGYVATSGRADPAVVECQLATVRHRGPDSSGTFVGGRGAIGQNRLAIIDVAGGDPPLSSEDGSVGVVLNGEIYNYRSLQDRLRSAGHTLATACDTEVIAHLAEDLLPVELARSLHGMFAFATWDHRRERLVLGRDRLGKKPLYWWAGPDAFVFGSEIKSLLAHPSVPRELDETVLPTYLRFGYVPTPRTFYAGIQSVPPGHVLVLDDGAPRLEPYWAPDVPGPGGPTVLDLGLSEAAAAVRRSLGEAVRRRMVADVPLGAFLSGGIDSSAVVGLMAEAVPGPVRTFTIGFEDGEGFDERPHARVVAERFGTDHTEFVVAPDAVDLVERLVWHHDQPFGDSSAVPTYLLSEMTKEHVTVALCGDGGDELFGGYERFAAGLAISSVGRIPAPVLGAATSLVDRLAPVGSRTPLGKAARFLHAADLGLPEAFRSWVSSVSEEQVEALAPGGDRWGVDDYAQVWASTAGSHPLDRLLELNLRTYLVDDLLPKVDRMAMAHGLEVRSPFLDHDLVELALRLPPSTKIRRLSLKRVLKAAVADLLPREIIDRPKKGFGVPLDRWFRQDLQAYVEGALGPGARLRAHVRGDALDAILTQHRAGVADHGHVLWTLLTLEVFLRREGW